MKNRTSRNRRSNCYSAMTILTLVQAGNWDVVAMRLKKMGEEDVAMLGVKSPTEDSLGRLPIHWACLYGPRLTKKGLRALLDAKPDSAKQVDDEGSTPLHILLQKGFVKFGVLKMLLDAFPEAVTMRDVFGRTPLFHLVEKHDIGQNQKIAALELILSAENGAEALTIPCGPVPACGLMPGFRSLEECSTITRMSRMSRIWEAPVAHRTPLYMMWNDALHDRSSRWWSRDKNTKAKPTRGKQMKKARLFLECAYLHRVNGSFSLEHRRTERMLRQMMKKAKSDLKSENNLFSRLRKKLPRSENVSLASLIHSMPKNDAEDHASPIDRISSHGAETSTLNLSSTSTLGGKGDWTTVGDQKRRTSSMYQLTSSDDGDRREVSHTQRTRSQAVRQSRGGWRDRRERSKAERQKIIKKKGEDLQEMTRNAEYGNDDSDDEDNFFISQRRIFKRLRSKKKETTKFRVTHAVVTLQEWLPKEVLGFALEYYPRQLEKKEEVSGRIPLHLAIVAKADIGVIEQLIAANRKTAAIRTADRRLPLHLTLEDSRNCNYSVIECVFDAHPDASFIQDPTTNLYPFMQAAVSTRTLPEMTCVVEEQPDGCEQLTTIYKLLLANPTVLYNAIDEYEEQVAP